ncbi:response regulator [Phenylobacterium sp.]|uniref:response regulator transcription factor n=1 Tax=Phenylobacterium sp. TaxID=1871053 RepID=UPI0025DDA0A0|nr:response regulator [Phenylobacterium sp.]
MDAPADLRILVVDDDDGMRSSLRTLLDAVLGIPTETAESVDAALRKIADDEDLCVLTDLRMPGRDGFSLLSDLRSRGRTNPVIVMSAYGEVAMAVRAMKEGADDFIEKPFEQDDLLAALERVRARHDARQRAAARISATHRLASLSPREGEVLSALMAGGNSRTIAAQLGISARTVEEYRRLLHVKTQTRSLPELLRLAIAADWRPDAPP